MHMQYSWGVQDELDWRHRGDYIAKHDMTPQWADEAFADPSRLMTRRRSQAGRSE